MRVLFRVTLFLCASALFRSAWAQEPVRYSVSFANAVHHEAHITATFTDVTANVLELRMSRSSPGRYALHEFAKNVYKVEARDRLGNPLAIDRPSPYQWNVENRNGPVTVSYTLFADRADGTYSQIDNSHAHLNMPATFMWARGLDGRALEVEFLDLNPDWKFATQLVATQRANVFTAPDLQYFMDSPTEISAFSLRQFPVISNGREFSIRLAVHHDADEQDVDEFAEMAQAVVAEHMAVYGELPEYDYGSYTFIADYLPWVNGDGMEHRNSTILSNSDSLRNNASTMLGTLSHEFFHSWNVERIRPRSLQPFNFEQANMSRELWLAEGFTQYYGNLLLLRAGMRTQEEYLGVLAGIINAVTLTPGREFSGPVGMSMQAPFVDAATALDPTNFSNIFLSYYTYGAGIALALDLTLRSQFDLTLDDYMRQLWQKFGRTETPYTLADLRATLAELTADPGFSESFFQQYIDGSALPDYPELLAHAGMLLRLRSPDSASLGNVNPEFEDGVATLTTATTIGSPLYRAGLDRGDQIHRIGGSRMSREGRWNRLLRRADPGESMSIEFMQRGVMRESEVTFIADPRLEVVAVESTEMQLTDSQIDFREDWLASKVP